MMQEVYLLLGSNLGDSRAYLAEAIRHIGNDIGPVERRSSLYQTASWGKTDQPDFINQVVCLHTDMEPRELLCKVLVIEERLGRKRIEKWGSRTIDIDILFYGEELINEPDLVIPHPFLHERRFTLMPLAELSPDFIHPGLKLSISQIAGNLTDSLAVKKISF